MLLSLLTFLKPYKASLIMQQPFYKDSHCLFWYLVVLRPLHVLSLESTSFLVLSAQNVCTHSYS